MVAPVVAMVVAPLPPPVRGKRSAIRAYARGRLGPAARSRADLGGAAAAAASIQRWLVITAVCGAVVAGPPIARAANGQGQVAPGRPRRSAAIARTPVANRIRHIRARCRRDRTIPAPTPARRAVPLLAAGRFDVWLVGPVGTVRARGTIRTFRSSDWLAAWPVTAAPAWAIGAVRTLRPVRTAFRPAGARSTAVAAIGTSRPALAAIGACRATLVIVIRARGQRCSGGRKQAENQELTHHPSPSLIDREIETPRMKAG